MMGKVFYSATFTLDQTNTEYSTRIEGTQAKSNWEGGGGEYAISVGPGVDHTFSWIIIFNFSKMCSRVDKHNLIWRDSTSFA